jgi:hypothetical protein
MGTNTTNPPAMSPGDASRALETALTDLQSITHLVDALACCSLQFDPSALHPVDVALEAVLARANPAAAVALPILQAAEAGRRGA